MLPSFGIESLPSHALPWRGRPLLAHAEVWHALGLPPEARALSESPARALVIGDPQGDLADARLEAERVAAVLAGRGMQVDTRIGMEATGPARGGARPEARLLHYAARCCAGTTRWAPRSRGRPRARGCRDSKKNEQGVR